MNSEVSGNDVTSIIVELPMHPMGIMCRNVSVGFVPFLVSPTSRACDLCPEGMYRQMMERCNRTFEIYTPVMVNLAVSLVGSHEPFLRNKIESFFDSSSCCLAF